MHRIRAALVLLVATLLIAGCAMPDQTRSNLAGPCRDGVPVQNADAPIVCIDDSSDVLRVAPDPFVLHATHSKGSGRPAVQFFTTSGRGNLRVVFDNERCVRDIRCNGGHCTAVASELNEGERERRCKYDVELTGHPTLDPEGVLTPCCVPGG